MTYGAWVGALVGFGAEGEAGAQMGAMAGALTAADEYESGKFVLAIGVWDPRTLEPIWTATTASYDLERGPEQVKRVADFVVEALRERGLL